jgi:hypothetical protein
MDYVRFNCAVPAKELHSRWILGCIDEDCGILESGYRINDSRVPFADLSETSSPRWHFPDEVVADMVCKVASQRTNGYLAD